MVSVGNCDGSGGSILGNHRFWRQREPPAEDRCGILRRFAIELDRPPLCAKRPIREREQVTRCLELQAVCGGNGQEREFAPYVRSQSSTPRLVPTASTRPS